MPLPNEPVNAGDEVLTRRELRAALHKYTEGNARAVAVVVPMPGAEDVGTETVITIWVLPLAHTPEHTSQIEDEKLNS